MLTFTRRNSAAKSSNAINCYQYKNHSEAQKMNFCQDIVFVKRLSLVCGTDHFLLSAKSFVQIDATALLKIQ